mmetsp:Transcript_16841/g.68822  ORF Transcript_16841/g.68822 Transcript_16841/m.68822 type:complete len:81 (-) Transcript_16841:2077-2319(-)
MKLSKWWVEESNFFFLNGLVSDDRFHCHGSTSLTESSGEKVSDVFVRLDGFDGSLLNDFQTSVPGNGPACKPKSTASAPQ